MRKPRISFIRPKRPNRYITGEGNTEPIRRPLRNATTGDRLVLFAFIFVGASIVTACLYIYYSLNGQVETPLDRLYGNTARLNIGLVSVGGGILGVIGYALLSKLDPYGTVESEKERVEKREKLEKLREEARQFHARRAAESESPGDD